MSSSPNISDVQDHLETQREETKDVDQCPAVSLLPSTSRETETLKKQVTKPSTDPLSLHVTLVDESNLDCVESIDFTQDAMTEDKLDMNNSIVLPRTQVDDIDGYCSDKQFNPQVEDYLNDPSLSRRASFADKFARLSPITSPRSMYKHFKEGIQSLHASHSESVSASDDVLPSIHESESSYPNVQQSHFVTQDFRQCWSRPELRKKSFKTIRRLWCALEFLVKEVKVFIFIR